MRTVITRLVMLALAATALAACDQDTYASNPEDRKTHMGEDLKAVEPPPTVSAPTVAPPAAPPAPAQK